MGNIVEKQAFMPPGEQEVPTLLKCKATLYKVESESGFEIPILVHRNDKGPGDYKEKFTIIFSHGNAESITLLDNFAAEISEILNVNVVLYEYVGYPFSPGKPTEKNTYEAAEAVLRFVKETLEVPENQIVLMGHSLGSGPSVHMALRGAGGLILVSPFCSAISVVLDSGVLSPFDIFKNLKKIHKVEVPTLILHGKNDEVISYEHAKRLYEKLREDKGAKYKLVLIEEAGHNDIRTDFQDIFFPEIAGYLEFLEKKRDT